MLIPQAVITDRASRAADADVNGLAPLRAPMDVSRGVATQTASPLVGLIAVVFMLISFCCAGLGALLGN